MKRLFLKVLNLRWLQHLVFWVLSIAFITSYFSISNEFLIVDLIYAICFHLCLFPLVYVILIFSIPKFLDQSRYLLFILSLLLGMLLAYGIHQVVFDLAIPSLLSGYYLVSFTDVNQLMVLFGSYSLITILLHLSKSYFKLQELEKDKLQMELGALKNQLNPHFLFNGLNSIYAFSLKKDDRAPEAILKLSDLLRYILYEVSSESISISKELSLIEKYIDLQKMRIRDQNHIQFLIHGGEEPQIVPMILFPLVENTFKHGNLAEDNSFLKIEVNYDRNQLEFRCVNTFDTNHKSMEKESGIGHDSILKILEIAYGSKARFNAISNGNVYSTTLNIDFR